MAGSIFYLEEFQKDFGKTQVELSLTNLLKLVSSVVFFCEFTGKKLLSNFSDPIPVTVKQKHDLTESKPLRIVFSQYLYTETWTFLSQAIYLVMIYEETHVSYVHPLFLKEEKGKKRRKEQIQVVLLALPNKNRKNQQFVKI